MERPARRSPDGPSLQGFESGLGALARRNRDLHDFAVLAGETGEQRFDQVRHEHVEPIGLRARLRAAVEQRLVASGGAATRAACVCGNDATSDELFLNPPVTAITVDRPTTIKTAAAISNSERRCASNVGPGGSPNSSDRLPVSTLAVADAVVPSRGSRAGALSICTALSSQQPNSSDTARCNDGSIERRGL